MRHKSWFTLQSVIDVMVTLTERDIPVVPEFWWSRGWFVIAYWKGLFQRMLKHLFEKSSKLTNCFRRFEMWLLDNVVLSVFLVVLGELDMYPIPWGWQMNLLTRFRAKSELELGIDFRPIPYFVLITHSTDHFSLSNSPFSIFDNKMDLKIILWRSFYELLVF